MKLVQRGNKWVLYDDKGMIVIMCRDRRICERMMEKCQ